MEGKRQEPLKPEIVDEATTAGSGARRGPHPPHAQSNQIPNFPGIVSTDGTAIITLGLAIASWLVIPIIGAIAALVIAPSAKRRIEESGGLLGGIGLVRAAQVIAIANLALFVLLAWIIVALLRAIF